MDFPKYQTCLTSRFTPWCIKPYVIISLTPKQIGITTAWVWLNVSQTEKHENKVLFQMSFMLGRKKDYLLYFYDFLVNLSGEMLCLVRQP